MTAVGYPKHSKGGIVMKKKIITLALATVMTFAFSITAAAAPSPKATPVAPEATVNGVAVNSVTNGISVSSDVQANAYEQGEASAKITGDAAALGLTVEKTVAIELNGVPADGTVTLSVAGLGVQPGDLVAAYHVVNGQVVKEAISVTGTDQVTLTGLTSCSPFYIVKLSGTPTVVTAAPAAAAATPVDATAVKSPKTGLSLNAVLAAVLD